MGQQKRSILWKIGKNELQKIVCESKTYADILRYFELYTSKGGNYHTLQRILKEYEIDCSTIITSKGRKGLVFGKHDPIPIEEILVANSTYNRSHLKKRLLENNILENKCQICGMLPEWNGKRLVLVIDHKNGNPVDNRIENLRLLCPNCNSQTETFCGKHKRRINNCSKCGKKIAKKSARCRKCENSDNNKSLQNRKVLDRPSLEKIQEMQKTMSMVSIGKKYGVSDNAVRNWIKMYIKMCEEETISV